jgi:hypothetical protein
MNTPHEPTDPLLRSLLEETTDLPARAAAAARQRSAQRRQSRRRLAQTAALALLSILAWRLFPTPTEPASTVAVVSPGATAPEFSPEPDAPTAPKLATPSLPSGLNPEQAQFVKALGNLPLLLVRDDSGKVTRIHLVER